MWEWVRQRDIDTRTSLQTYKDERGGAKGPSVETRKVVASVEWRLSRGPSRPPRPSHTVRGKYERETSTQGRERRDLDTRTSLHRHKDERSAKAAVCVCWT